MDREAVGGTAAEDSGRALLEAELERVTNALSSLEREGQRAPWLAVSGLLAVPVGLRWGLGVGLFALAVSLSLVLVGAYIAWAHRQEYRQSEAAIRERLEQLDRPAARVAKRGTPWRVAGKATVLFE